MRIGIANGASYGEEFDLVVKQGLFQTLTGKHPANQLAMLLSGRVDAVLISGGQIGLEGIFQSYEAKQVLNIAEAREKLHVLPKPFSLNPNYVAFAKSQKQKELLKTIDALLKAARESGELKKIEAKYLKALKH